MMTEEKDNQTPWEDPIVDEVRKVREMLYADSGYNLDELGRRLREKQMLSGRVVVSRSKHPPRDANKEAKGVAEQSGRKA
ncbi:MAG: hypothetical protein ACM34H_02375 [Deltaproteobacteria bacterium]